ncbi:MAG TPA: tyrosinase family protein [Candidatus Angelobacter sp.]|nr:tyrosinase family protein [Candidatus Angelobacter sp.]
MERDVTRRPNRRRFLQGAATIAGSAAFASNSFFSTLSALAQDPPTCPAPPSGGTPFAPGSDTRPIVLRKSAGALTPAEVTKFKAAYTALRGLPASDKRTWVLQADIHALYCHQCTGDPTQIHGSWNFFPWHRAYLYYFERILGSLVGDLNNFRIPYWDWENIRTLPSPYVSPNNSTNSLWDGNRNSGMAGGGSLPASDGTSARIAVLDGMTDFATFGGTSGWGGACENDPHGNIHMDCGVVSSPHHDMGNLGYAARDALFFAHHCNIDKIWSNWNGLSGPPGAYKNPTDPGFLNARWSFWDENQHAVSISAADVLNHEKNLRYTYTPFRFQINPYLIAYICELICCIPGPDPGPYIKVSEEVRNIMLAKARQLAQEKNPENAVVLVLQGVAVPANIAGNFEIVAVREQRSTPLGTLSLIGDTEAGMRERRPITLILDISRSLEDLFTREKPASLHVRRRGEQRPGIAALKEPTFTLKAERAEIRMQRK